MPTPRTTEAKLDLLIQKVNEIRTSHAVLEAQSAELARRLAEVQSEMVTRDVCAARHKPLNGFVADSRDDRRARWPLYLMGTGIGVSIVLSILNLVLS